MLALLLLAHVSLGLGFSLNSGARSLQSPVRLRGGATPLSSAATTEQAKSGLGWDSHKAIDQIPESLVNAIEGNESMRRKFEALCRGAQNSICKAIEELDGEGKFREDAWVRESG
jgi:coproporphyrinogen III oxidase